MKKGFTLIELLVVIAIIGLLASIVMVSLNSARAKARDAKRISDLKQLQLALELYYDTYGRYPIICWSTDPENYIPGLTPVYLNHLPRDPSYGSYCGAIGSNDGIWNYHYCSDGLHYKINTCSERTVGINDPFYDPVRAGNKLCVCSDNIACTTM